MRWLPKCEPTITTRLPQALPQRLILFDHHHARGTVVLIPKWLGAEIHHLVLFLLLKDAFLRLFEILAQT